MARKVLERKQFLNIMKEIKAAGGSNSDAIAKIQSLGYNISPATYNQRKFNERTAFRDALQAYAKLPPSEEREKKIAKAKEVLTWFNLERTGGAKSSSIDDILNNLDTDDMDV